MSLRRVYEPPAPAQTRRGDRSNSWWQICGVAEFKERIDAMSLQELEPLFGEIRGACSVISVTVQNKEADPAHRSRARAALGFVSEKRRVLQARIQREETARHDAGRELTKTVAKEARTALENGDLSGALSRIIDWLDQFSSRKKLVTTGNGSDP